MLATEKTALLLMPSDVRLPPSRSYPQLSRWPVRARLISLLLLLYGLRHVSLFLLPAYKARQQRGKGAFGLPIGIVQSLGPYSPWYAVEEYVPWGPDCELTQVNIVRVPCSLVVPSD